MAKKAIKSVGKKAVTKKVALKKPRKPPRMLTRYECELIAGRMTASGLDADRHRVAEICKYAMKHGYELEFAKTDAFIIAFFANPPAHPVRLLLNEVQCKTLWRSLIDFGYEDLSLEKVKKVAMDVHAGSYSDSDVIAVLVVKQVDDLQDEMYRRGIG